MQFNFDFIGIQNIFPSSSVTMPSSLSSRLRGKAVTRKVPHTAMGWEINPDSSNRLIKRFWLYGGVKEIIISESGAAFKDELINGW